MKFSLEMASVSSCEVTRCAYNVDGACHAKAITVGDGVHAGCDTYVSSDRHTADDVAQAGVGACKVAVCRYNVELECGAREIAVGAGENGAECLTFEFS
jgi:hypothetical protein